MPNTKLLTTGRTAWQFITVLLDTDTVKGHSALGIRHLPKQIKIFNCAPTFNGALLSLKEKDISTVHRVSYSVILKAIIFQRLEQTKARKSY